MSLFDVDKKSDNGQRLNPAPNSNDEMADRLAHGTTQNHNAGEEAQADGLKLKERQILAVQDGFNKAVFGFYGDANKFGLKVAKDGFDVLTAVNADLVFNSEQNVFKIVQTGTITVTKPAGVYTGDATVTHNLGFTPSVMAFSGENGGVPLPDFSIFTSGTDGGKIWRLVCISSVTTTAVTFSYDTPSIGFGTTGPLTVDIKYYLLQETAN